MSTPDHDSSDGPDRPRASQLERLRRGDEDAWEEVVRAHGARLLAVARRIVREAVGHSVCHEFDESLPPEVPPRLVAAIARARSAQG